MINDKVFFPLLLKVNLLSKRSLYFKFFSDRCQYFSESFFLLTLQASCNATQGSGGIDNAGMVERLCCHGANVNKRAALWSTKAHDITFDTVIPSSCRVPCMASLDFAQSPACAKILLEHGADMCA